MPTPFKPPLDDVPAWSVAQRGVAPAFLVDVAHGVLVDANAAAQSLWWEEGVASSLPLWLDRSMPALHALREAAGSQHAQGCLTFWTPRGPLALRCAWQRAAADSPLVAIVGDNESETARAPLSSQPRARLDLPLTSKLAHELRTPLGAVMTYSEVLAQEHFGPLSNPRYRDYIRTIRDSARHALSVLDRMTAQPDEAGEGKSLQLRFRDLDPAAIVESCITVIRPLATQAGLVLDVTFPSDLPRIVADEVSLRQMLLNLLTNAVKFARRGDRVTLAVTRAEDGGLTFAVEDTGPGMDAGEADAAAVQAAKGLGLGIPLTRELAEVNGAALAIESAPGAGTRARISFGKARVVPV